MAELKEMQSTYITYVIYDYILHADLNELLLGLPYDISQQETLPTSIRPLYPQYT